jgi:hypothetical protein
LNDLLRKEISDRIVEEVLYRLKELEPKDVVPKSAAVLVTSFIPSFPKADRLIRERFGADVTYIDFCGYDFPDKLEQVVSAGEKGEDAVLKLVNGSESVVLLAPKLKLIERIAEGDDEDFVSYLTIRSLLWGRRVSAVLDFEPPAFKRNTFFEKVAGTVEVLEGIGIEVTSYDCSYEEQDARSLITEADVVEEWKKGRSEVLSGAGAIITPSARDKALELGIRIN